MTPLNDDTGPGHYTRIATDSGDFYDAFECEPPAGTPVRGGLVLLHEIFGITRKIRRYAQDYANEGLHVLAPDLFWRSGRRVELGHDPESMKQAMARLKTFDDEAAVDDVAAAVNSLRARHPGLPVSILGFCLGGKLAVMARMRALADRYVTYYGVGVEHVAGDLARNDAPLLMHYGSQDTYVPPATVQAYAPRLGHNTQVHFYPEAGHAFYVPGKDAASALSRSRTLDFLSLPTSSQD